MSKLQRWPPDRLNLLHIPSVLSWCIDQRGSEATIGLLFLSQFLCHSAPVQLQNIFFFYAALAYRFTLHPFLQPLKLSKQYSSFFNFSTHTTIITLLFLLCPSTGHDHFLTLTVTRTNQSRSADGFCFFLPTLSYPAYRSKLLYTFIFLYCITSTLWLKYTSHTEYNRCDKISALAP